MERIIRDLTSAHWWITVAVASLAFNILAIYCVRGLDRVFPKLSARLRSWAGRKMSEFESDIDRTSQDVQTMTLVAARQAAWHVGALHNYVLGALFFYGSGKWTSPAFVSTLL